MADYIPNVEADLIPWFQNVASNLLLGGANVAGQPETRYFRARFREKDLPVGDLSAEVNVTARP